MKYATPRELAKLCKCSEHSIRIWMIDRDVNGMKECIVVTPYRTTIDVDKFLAWVEDFEKKQLEMERNRAEIREFNKAKRRELREARKKIIQLLGNTE